jgi:hypothetical protein
MGPWASAIVAVASCVAFVIAVFAFRGFMETVEGVANRCAGCGREGRWPLPGVRHECWRCRHAAATAFVQSHRAVHR